MTDEALAIKASASDDRLLARLLLEQRKHAAQMRANRKLVVYAFISALASAFSAWFARH